MNIKIEKDNKVDYIIGAAIIVVSIIGVFPIGDFKLFGIVMTYYRLLVPLFLAFYIVEGFANRRWSTIAKNKLLVIGMLIAIVWIIYGCIQIIANNTISDKENLKELMTLAIGFVSIGLIVRSLQEPRSFQYMIYALKSIYCGLILLGLIEMITGWHLYTSQYCDLQQIEYYNQLHPLEPIDKFVSYNATGIFYGPNDFAAFLAIFAPLFLKHEIRKISNIFNTAVLLAAFLLIIRNDAWITFIALLIGLIVYIILTHAKLSNVLIKAAGIYLIYRWGVKAFYTLIMKGYELFLPYRTIPEGIKVAVQGTGTVETVVAAQVGGMNEGYGSLFLRINTYLEGIKETFTKTYGLGFGPNGFSRYFSEYAIAPVLANPHCLWLEIFSQYGIIIFSLYVGYLIYIYIKLIKLYLQERCVEYAVIIAMDTVLVFASFSPSTFLAYAYQWILIAWTLSFVVRRRI